MAASRLRLSPGWGVARDAEGNLFIVDRAGMRPLEHPDPTQRLFAHYLAAAAPDLRIALEDLARRFEYLFGPGAGLSYTQKMDGKLLQGAFGAIICSRPPWSFVEELQEGQKAKGKKAA